MDVESCGSWSYQQTMLLIHLFKGYKDSYYSPFTRKKVVWQQISKKMTESGYTIPPKMCGKKWRRLKSTYKAITESMRKGECKRNWIFYKHLNEIYKSEGPPCPTLLSTMNYNSPQPFVNIIPKNWQDNKTKSSKTNDSDVSKKRPGKMRFWYTAGEPSWFTEFRYDLQRENEQNRRDLWSMHDENMQIEKERNDITKDLVKIVQHFIDKEP